MDTKLIRRIAFSVLSGIGVGLLLVYGDIFDKFGGSPGFYGVSGLVFAIGVLFPYLERGDRLVFRALTLAIASAVSYYSAVWLALEGPIADSNGWLSFTLASIAGAAIVMTALVLTTTIRPTRNYVLYGLAAGIIGGPVTHATLPNDDLVLAMVGNAVWHTLVCLAIYFATKNRNRGEFLN